jgi:phenylacetate-coenzyme A ligase PaaK-like adenylate-forming protein
LIETPGTGAFECDHGRLHFVDASALVEFLHPQTAEPVQPGEAGVAVITTFHPDRELMPLLRYWTDDLMRTPHDPFCPCGNVATSVEVILGRRDHMVTVGGQNFYPQPIGDVLTSFPELSQPPRFTFGTEQRTEAEYAVIEVECASKDLPSHAAELRDKILSMLPVGESAHVTAGKVKVELCLVPAGTHAHPIHYKLQRPS